MGVDLSSILKKDSISFPKLTAHSVAIDAFNALYQFLSSIRQYDGALLSDEKGRPTSHLVGLFYRTAKMLRQGIIPVYIFDGKPPDFKKQTIDKRREIKEQAMLQWIAAKQKGDVDQAKKFAQRTSRLTESMIKESKSLLDAMGVNVVNALSEGEAEAAVLSSKGIVNFCSSQDYDSLLFGAKSLIRNLTFSDKRYGKSISLESIDLQENLKTLGINREQLILIGLACGTDFNKGVYGIGAKKGLALVKKYPHFDEFVNAIGRDKFEDNIKEVFDFFLNPPVNQYKPNFRFRNKTPDLEQIKRILCDEHNFSESRVENTFSSFSKSVSSQQTLLSDW